MNPEDLKGRKPPRAPNTLTAREAADLIEEVRRALTLSISEAGVVSVIHKVLRERGIEPLTPCKGEAHSNPHVDHCGSCMPRWGWVGAPVCVGRSKPSGSGEGARRASHGACRGLRRKAPGLPRARVR